MGIYTKCCFCGTKDSSEVIKVIEYKKEGNDIILFAESRCHKCFKRQTSHGLRRPESYLPHIQKYLIN